MISKGHKMRSNRSLRTRGGSGRVGSGDPWGSPKYFQFDNINHGDEKIIIGLKSLK